MEKPAPIGELPMQSILTDSWIPRAQVLQLVEHQDCSKRDPRQLEKDESRVSQVAPRIAQEED